MFEQIISATLCLNKGAFKTFRYSKLHFCDLCCGSVAFSLYIVLHSALIQFLSKCILYCTRLMLYDAKIRRSVCQICCSWWDTDTQTLGMQPVAAGFCCPSWISPQQMNLSGAAVPQNLPVYHTLAVLERLAWTRKQAQFSASHSGLPLLFKIPQKWGCLLNMNLLIWLEIHEHRRQINETWRSEQLFTTR